MRPNVLPAAAACLTAAALASSASAAAATPLAPLASPNSYEQISRATGAQGFAPFTYSMTPRAVSDTGRYGVVSAGPINGSQTPTLVRDIKTNVTSQLGAPGEQAVGFDSAEKLALIVRTTLDTLTYIVRPVTGGPDKVVATLPQGGLSYEPSAAISGNGKVVAIAGGADSITLYTLATGAKKSYVVEQPHLNVHSLSDDASVIAGLRSYSSGFKIVKGVVTDLDLPAMVSGNGAVLVTLADSTGQGSTPNQVVVQRLSDGATKAYDMPEGGGNLAWVSPDGSRAAVFPGLSASQSYAVNFATGKWSTFGGAFTRDLSADMFGFNPDPSAVISRSGRYAVVEYGNPFSGQTALVDLTGGDLPGDQEPLSASSYLSITPPITFGDCSAVANLNPIFARPAVWAPKPRKAELIVTIDGKETFRKTYTKAYDPRDANDYPELVQVPYPGTAKKITLVAKVTDDQGRLLTTTETTAPFCLGSFPL